MNAPFKSVLAGISTTLPASGYARQQLHRAAKAGFRWPTSALVVDKIKEELGEVEGAITKGDKTEIHNEIGDLLHAVHTLAEFHGVDPQAALASANDKFTHRFTALEREAHRLGKTLHDIPLKEQIRIWNAQKPDASQSPSR